MCRRPLWSSVSPSRQAVSRDPSRPLRLKEDAMTVRETSPACPALPVQPLAWSRTFPATPLQVREARRFLTRVLDGRPAADDAALCLGEVATNAMIHSRSRDGGHFTVRAQRSEEHTSELQSPC